MLVDLLLFIPRTHGEPSIKSKREKYLNFLDSVVAGWATQLCHLGIKATTDDVITNVSVCFLKKFHKS